MIVKLLTEHHFEFLSLKGGCTSSSESTHIKMPHCWKSHAAAHILNMVEFIFELLTCWVIFHDFLLTADLFQNQHFKKKSFRNTIRVSNNIDPDQVGHFVRPELGPNCL